MIRTTTSAAVAVGAALVAFTVSACGGGHGVTDTAGPSPTARVGTAIVYRGNSGLGTILTNSKGFTVYLFEKDSRSRSACTGACAAAWPPLLATGKRLVGTGLNASLVGTARRAGANRR